MPCFVRAPEGNAYCEWFIRILKENLLWVRSFATVEELRWALLEFKNLYNHHWILEGYGYRTPAQARQEKLAQVAEAARSNGNNPGAVQVELNSAIQKTPLLRRFSKMAK